MDGFVSAGAGVHPYLARQVEQLRRWRGPALRGEEDAVHQMRVATRRLRSLLATYGHLYAEIPLSRRRLRWLAGVLGEVRDLEVLRMRFAVRLGEERPEWFAELERAERRAYRRLARACERPRFRRLMKDARRMAERPRFSAEAVRPAPEVLAPVITEARRELEDAFRDIAAAEDADAPRHHARKVAKRVRYTAEAASWAFDEAEALASEAKRLQTVCGRYQDAVVAVAYIEAHTGDAALLEAERSRRAKERAEVDRAGARLLAASWRKEPPRRRLRGSVAVGPRRGWSRARRASGPRG